MRLPILFLAVALLVLVGSRTSHAYEGPWCAVVSIGAGAMQENCSFQTFEECAPNVIAGNRGFCNRNPRWPGYYQSQYQDYPAGPKRHRKAHASHDR